MMTKRLVLFDIDGTLLTSGGAGERALRLGFQDSFGVVEDLTGIEIAGRTDSGIARQVLRKHNLEVSPENIARFFDGYLHHLALLLPQLPGRLLPGISTILQRLKGHPEVVLGLLTGNLQRGAELKLVHYGIWEYFEFGAFADDHHDRNELGRFAQLRARDRHGVDFPAASIYVLGDTPHDVTCARAVGAKAIAIATGNYTLEQLQGCGADVVFSDLSDIEAVLKALDL